MKKYLVLTIFLVFALSVFVYANNSLSAEEYQVIPNNNEIIHDCNSTVSILFNKSLLNNIEINNTKIFLNSKEISKKCLYNGNSITYLPIISLPAGINQAEAFIVYKDGGEKSVKWTFNVISKDNITSVEHDAVDTLIINEDLKVTIKGIEGARASFDIGDKIKNIPLKETSPGIYEGVYKIKPIDNFGSEDIIGHLKFNTELESSCKAEKQADIRGDLFLVKIISPKPEDRVGKSFEIIGRTKPHALVMISSLMWLKNIPIVNELKATTGGYEAKADENGIFKMKYGIPFELKDSTYTLKFLGKDDKGNYSIPNTVTVTTRGGKD
ncbi:MAG: hypothetical protein ABIH00_09920 [Armatimonadota bacterium]